VKLVSKTANVLKTLFSLAVLIASLLHSSSFPPFLLLLLLSRLRLQVGVKEKEGKESSNRAILAK
jgi:hypothetical protein